MSHAAHFGSLVPYRSGCRVGSLCVGCTWHAVASLVVFESEVGGLFLLGIFFKCIVVSMDYLE